MAQTRKQLNNYFGAIHIHSRFSDGTGDVIEISRAAKLAGLDWIIITDHNNMDIQEGFFNDVCVIKGEEISPKDNHYLALGINDSISEELSPEGYVKEVRNKGGFGFAAHPDESDKRENNNRPIKWTNKDIKPDGIEIWNWFSTWADNYSDKNLIKLIYSYFFKHNLVKKPRKETLKWWDELNKSSENIIPAIGGVDAHALKVKKYIIPVTIFPYKDLFRTITNVIFLNEPLSNNFDIAKKQILNSIKNGRNIIVNRHICKELPEIYIQNENSNACCGEKIKLDNKTFLIVKLPKKFGINVLFEGQLIWNKKAKYAKIPLLQKGKYRVEITLNKFGYAYSNPIILT